MQYAALGRSGLTVSRICLGGNSWGAADRRRWAPFIAMQNLYSLLYREEEREMNPFCVADGVALIPYSPLARGVLAGTRSRAGGGATERAREDKQASPYFTEEGFAIVDRVVALAEARGVKPGEVALAWLLQQPGLVAPVIGSTALGQIDDAPAATGPRLPAAAT